MKSYLRRKNSVTLVVIFIFSLLLSSIVWGWRTFEELPVPEGGRDSHKQMTEAAIKLLKSEEYPDICKFQNEIIDGSGGWRNDLSADPEILKKWGITPGTIHTAPYLPNDNENFEYTNMCRTKWNEYIKEAYDEKLYQGIENAYWWLGTIAHLTQDSSAPPHAFKCHGTSKPCELCLPFDLLPLGDQIEYHASQVENITQLGSDPAYDQGREVWIYPDATGIKTKAWCGLDDFCKKHFTDGRYGETWVDDFPAYAYETYYEKARAVVIQVVGIGINHTAGMLETASKKLPPIVYNVEAHGQDPGCGFLTLTVEENRMPEVDLEFIIRDRCKNPSFPDLFCDIIGLPSLDYELEVGYVQAGESAEVVL